MIQYGIHLSLLGKNVVEERNDKGVKSRDDNDAQIL